MGLTWWQCGLAWLLLTSVLYGVSAHSIVSCQRQNRRTGSTQVVTAAARLQVFKARSQLSARDWIRPGRDLRDEGLRPKHPVVVVPGK